MTKLRGQWEQPSISALGQKATLQCDRCIFALPLEADIHQGDDRVSFQILLAKRGSPAA